MKLIRSASFAAIVFAMVNLYTLLVLTTPLAIATEWTVRREWFAANPVLWMVGGWLALLAIFAWMVLLMALMYAYIPAHRLSTMLQSGLMLIGAVLLVIGIVIWMNLLPSARDATQAAFVDELALSILSAGFFMGGAVTAWIAVDLARLQKIPRLWLLPGLLAGLLALPSPFLLPNPILLLSAMVLFFVWALLLGVRRMPAAYAEIGTESLRPSLREDGAHRSNR
jgi:hypothetical protein